MALNPIQLTPKQKSFLRAQAHKLGPVVMTGSSGLTEAVLNEIELSVAHHELIKIKLGGADKVLRQQMADEICARTGAAAVQIIGRILVIYRSSKEQRIKLP